MEWLVFRLLLVRLSMAMASFSPNTEDQDAYGIKIAGNDILFVQANSRERTFFVHMTSHNTDGSPYQCSFSYRDPVHYIYTVGIGSKQYDIDPAFFYYAGEALPTDAKGDHGSGHNGAFVTVMRKPYIVWRSPGYAALIGPLRVSSISRPMDIKSTLSLPSSHTVGTPSVWRLILSSAMSRIRPVV